MKVRSAPSLSERNNSNRSRLAVVVKNPSDFTGAVLGESEKNTKGILSNSVGKVLVIDEVC